jgi:predicted TPR repeat methyltransferase
MLRHTNRYEEAVEYYRRAILKWPNKTEIMHLLAACLRYSRQPAEAAEIYREILNIKPNDATALHLLAATTGIGVPARSSDDYITHLFDGFSQDFDKVLDRLGYRAPDLVVAALDLVHPGGGGDLHVLDVGCGTGLCGPGLRAYARTLEGVDLSAGMLDMARERECYDALHQSELTAWLGTHPHTYDVLTSADTLCYFGDLGAVFTAAAEALAPGGWFIFTVEASGDEDADDWRIYPHGRYSHRGGYLESGLQAAGLSTERIDNEQLRMESGQPVAGWVVVARRPA